MAKSIKIFKSFEEQENYHLQNMARSTVQERFRSLLAMQQMTLKLHPVKDKSSKIIIRNGYSKIKNHD